MLEISIKTSRFGDIVVEEDRMIKFARPIIGFDHLTNYVLLDHGENSPFRWLQSSDDPNLAFVVTNPSFFGIDYSFDLPPDVSEELNIEDPNDMVALTIVKIPHDNPNLMTANLMGPVIINQNTLNAAQVVLSDTEYSTRTRLVSDELINQTVDSPSSSYPEGGGQ